MTTIESDIDAGPGTDSPLRRRRRRRGRTTWLSRVVNWVVIPLIVVVVAEGIARVGLRSYGPWYSQTGPVDFVFIGSSRVASAIDENAFADVMAAYVGHPVRVLNLGRGDSTAAEQALGLRALDQSMPRSARKYVLFIEAPGGLPDPLMQGTWKDPWVFPAAKGLIVRMLRGQDIGPMWSSHMGFGTKLQLSVEWLLQRSDLVTYKDGWHDIIINKSTTELSRGLGKVDPSLNDTSSQPANLRSAGGIRTDPAGVELAREEAIATKNQDLSTQTAWGNWDGQIIADIVRRHEAEGGQVVFYDMPLSSYFQRTYATTTRAGDRAVFTKWEDQIGTPHVHPHFATSDADFPDLWHMSASLAPVFTRALAQAWLNSGCAGRSGSAWTARCTAPSPPQGIASP